MREHICLPHDFQFLGETPMSLEQNKAIWHRLIEAMNMNNESLLMELVAPDIVDHYAPPGLPPGRAGWNITRKFLRSAFPDGHWTEEEVIAEGELVAGRYTFRGTHLGEFCGIPATGKQVVVATVQMGRILDGKVVEHWGNGDNLGMMQQLSALPTLQASEF
jgi:predicted ester cyclase